ncbi:hypothetical protein U9C02_003664 [Klebsiella pneumoniae]|nr:hypothetical protein [Klebsiella pneumoniae]
MKRCNYIYILLFGVILVAFYYFCRLNESAGFYCKGSFKHGISFKDDRVSVEGFFKLLKYDKDKSVMFVVGEAMENNKTMHIARKIMFKVKKSESDSVIALQKVSMEKNPSDNFESKLSDELFIGMGGQDDYILTKRFLSDDVLVFKAFHSSPIICAVQNVN